jgi:uncharacterized protein (DUF2062 family)
MKDTRKTDVPPRICVVVPVYNHGLTVGRVAREASEHFPVIAVDDGSTDQTSAALAQEAKQITIVTLPENRGKAAALKAGFDKAQELGFTHAISVDADGQHPVDALPRFAAACRSHPEAMIIGVRDLVSAGAPRPRRISNSLSTFWFRFETGVRLTDTQCGLRVYPLEAVRELHLRSNRYAWELEVMVKGAWAGIPLIPEPVQADYAAPTSRMSHFHPLKDFLRISRLHSRLAVQAFCVPAPLRRMAAQGTLGRMQRGHRFRAILRHLFSENTETPARLSSAVGLGLFFGIAPFWGFQMFLAALAAHRLRLNKAIALTASNISFPLAAPFIWAGALILGNLLWTGEWMAFEARVAPKLIPIYFAQWLLGSFVLAIGVAAIGLGASYLIARVIGRTGRPSGDQL